MLKKKPIEYWIKRAEEIAREAHHGQFRKGGLPYISHPQAVASGLTDRLKPIGFLHDVPEDTHWTIEDLEKEGFPDYIIAAVTLLTHKDGQSNIQYWSDIATNPDAVAVKVQDIKHNLSDDPSENARVKYARALDFFKSRGYSV